jgi:hypothetical protein
MSSHLTFSKEGSLTEQRNMLQTRLRAWDQLLPIYMPGLLQYETDLAKGDSTTSTTPNQSPHPEDSVIWLPSRIAVMERARVCRPGLAQMEERLRSGQCRDALESVCQVLRLKSRMVEFKNKQVREQRRGLRSRTLIDRVHERARASAEKYHVARKAIYDLEGPGEWEETFKVLEDSDIRGYQDPNRLRPRKGRQGIWEDGQEPGEHPALTTMGALHSTTKFDISEMGPEKRVGPYHGYGQRHGLRIQMTPRTTSCAWSGRRAGRVRLELGRKSCY